MTKVMLINPPRKDYDKSMNFGVYFPIGLLSIASIIRPICEVKIFDCLIEDFEIIKKEDYTLYGTPFEKIKEAIKEFNPDIVGISIPFSTQSENSRKICEICKEVNPKIIVVFGGPDTSVRYESLLKETSCDFCVIGEGEKTFYEFIDAYNKKNQLINIKGLAHINNNKLTYKPREFIEILDELPLPAYDLIDINSYLKNKYLYKFRSDIKNSMSIITSRGCPFNCNFCSIHLHMGKKFRAHSVDYIMKHLRHLIDNYNIKSFHFEDDNISLDKKRFEQLLDTIIENKLNIKWDCPNGIRADTLDINLLNKIKKSGCKKLSIAIESGNKNVLNKIINKEISLEYIFEIIKYCKKINLSLSSFYLIGFPGEKLEEMKETVDLALKLLREYDVFPSLHIVTPLYGTRLYESCIKNGFIGSNLTDKDFSNATQVYGTPLISTEDFSKEDIKKILNDYIVKLKKETIIYSIKHPFLSFKKVKDKLPIVYNFLSYKNKRLNKNNKIRL